MRATYFAASFSELYEASAYFLGLGAFFYFYGLSPVSSFLTFFYGFYPGIFSDDFYAGFGPGFFSYSFTVGSVSAGGWFDVTGA